VRRLVLVFVLLLAASCVLADPPRNVRGIHTLIQDCMSSEMIEKHLTWAHTLVGDWGCVTQLFYPIYPNTQGPQVSWIEFLNKCYEKKLVPVVRIGLWMEEGHWVKPPDTPNGTYGDIAEAIKRVVQGLPRSDQCPLYVEIGNEPNLAVEWSGEPSPEEYADYFVAVANKIREIGDPRIKILNGALSMTNGSPVGDIDTLEFIRRACEHNPDFINAFDVWATHCYGANGNPPWNNIHDGTWDDRYCIDGYLKEFEVLAQYGRDTSQLKVIATETGYWDVWLGGDKQLVAEYTRAAYYEYWENWPEIIAMCGWYLSNPFREGGWVYYDSGTTDYGYPTHTEPVYDYVAYLKPEGYGTIQGTVLNAQTLQPVQGATVVTMPRDISDVTDSDGVFTLANLEQGSYVLEISCPGYVPQEYEWVFVEVNKTASVTIYLEPLQNALQNPSFEEPDLAGWLQYGGGMYRAGRGGFADGQPYDGDYFAQMAASYWHTSGGLYQIISVEQGKEYRASVWSSTYWLGGYAYATRNRIGLDPLGGDDPTAPTILWSDWDYNPVENEQPPSWRQIAVSAVAASNQMTIFLDYVMEYNFWWHINNFDMAEFYEVVPEAEYVSSPEGWLKPGWNLISVPTRPVDPSPASVFADLIGWGNTIENALFMYDGIYKVYPGDFSYVEPGRGYWLYLTTGAQDGFQGYPYGTDFLLQLDEGWNLVGNPYASPVPWRTCRVINVNEGAKVQLPTAVDAGWIASPAYFYDDGYEAVAIEVSGNYMEPWYGYWVLVLQDGVYLEIPKP